MIVLEAVTRCFGAVRAIDGLSLEVGRGEVVGFLGHNGAGKTTAVRLIAGLLAPDSGRLRVNGLDPVTAGAEVRRQLGVLPGSAAVDDRLTGRDNLRFAGELFDLPRRGLEARIAELLERFDLGGRADARAGGYSTGMRQRLSLARVLLHDPAVLLLDEPTASLDPVAARQVRDLIADLGSDSDRTVVLCTHDLAEAERLCDRVAILEHGRIRTMGIPKELAAATGGAGVLVEVHPDDTDDAAAVQLDGGGPGNVVAPGQVRWPGATRADVPSLVRALALADVRVFDLARAEPTLEDVYLALYDEPVVDQVSR